AVVGSGRFNLALWSALLAPVWLLFAKLLGLYDRDQRSLRHLTVDELPGIVTWSLASTAALVLFLSATPAGQLSAGEALQVGVVASAAAFLLRACARSLWRRITPPEQALIIGEGPLAHAARRKLELFPDIHVAVTGERGNLSPGDLDGSPDYLRRVDRILVATSHLDEELIAALVGFCRRRQIKP